MNFFKDLDIIMQNINLFAPFFFIIGACLGSFFNVVSFRYPLILDSENASDIKEWLKEKNITIPSEIDNFIKNLSLSFPRSHCYSCKTPLKWWHNIPIISYFLLKGKCGHCGVKYSFQYPFVEFLSGLLMLSLYLVIFPKYGSLSFLIYSIFFMLCFVMILTDLRAMLLPDGLNYFLLWFGLFISVFNLNIYENIKTNDAILGALVGFLIFYFLAFFGKLIKGIDVMGGGDVKLIAAIGAFLGIKGVIFVIAASPFLGIFTWLVIKICKKEQIHVPYGPSLIITSWVYIFYGKEILNILGLNLIF